MIVESDEEYRKIDLLFKNGEPIKSLKMLCNLIVKKNCSNNILINYRKMLYSTFITGDHGINDDAVIMFKYAIEKCTINNETLNIPFIKKAIYYLEQKNNPDYNLINNWLNYFNVNLLSENIYGNNKYSDKDMYYLKKAKILDLLNKTNELKDLFLKYNQELQIKADIIFFIKYHICRNLFNNSLFDDANELLKDLLLSKRETYVLGLPIKYCDYTDQVQTMFFVIELLLERHLDDYLYVYILIWLNNSSYNYIVNGLKGCYEYNNKKYKIINRKKLRNSIILNAMKDNNIELQIKSGKIVKITKSKNAFLNNGESNIFVDKKYLDKNIKVGDMVKYFVIEKYNCEKKCVLSQAVIINIGGNYEVLRSKKRK